MSDGGQTADSDVMAGHIISSWNRVGAWFAGVERVRARVVVLR